MVLKTRRTSAKRVKSPHRFLVWAEGDGLGTGSREGVSLEGSRMKIRSKELAGVGRIPNDRTSISAWMERRSIPVVIRRGNGGDAEYVSLADLPEDVRLAYWRRELDRMHLPSGTFDDTAHEMFSEAPAKSRARAERKAMIAAMLTGLRAQGAKEGERFKLVREKFGDKGTSNASLKKLSKAVQGVDPINYAPALLDDYKATVKRAALSEDAWRFFMTMIRDAAPDWPLTEAWRRTRDAGKEMGWDFPSYPTFYRRWNELDNAQRLQARLGGSETAKRLSIPAQRDKSSILALEWVSLDGRTLDFWVDWDDGKAARPVMLALVDVASNMVLYWELGPSENAVGGLPPEKWSFLE
jgi:putative transposase